MTHAFNLDERLYALTKIPTEIGISEYELASKKLDSDHKAIMWGVNTSSLLAPSIWYLGYQLHVSTISGGVKADTISSFTAIYLLFTLFITIMSLGYVANLRKNKVFAERKIVFLRRAMGINYGKSSLILPSWRIEGADNPFSLRMFPGFFHYSIFPVFLLSGFSSLAIVILFDNLPIGPISPQEFELGNPSLIAQTLGGSWFFVSVIFFRMCVREQH